MIARMYMITMYDRILSLVKIKTMKTKTHEDKRAKRPINFISNRQWTEASAMINDLNAWILDLNDVDTTIHKKRMFHCKTGAKGKKETDRREKKRGDARCDEKCCNLMNTIQNIFPYAKQCRKHIVIC